MKASGHSVRGAYFRPLLLAILLASCSGLIPSERSIAGGGGSGGGSGSGSGGGGGGDDSGSGSGSSIELSLSVSALYPSNGANWNDYVKNDGPSVAEGLDVACAGTEDGFLECLHGGEMRKVEIEGISSCGTLALEDDLGVFDWTCFAAGGGADIFFYSSSIKSGMGLADLVTSTSFKSNFVSISGSVDGQSYTGQSAAALWWSNPVRALPDNSAGSPLTIDGVDEDGGAAGDGSDDVYAAGTILTLAANRSTEGYVLGLDKLSIVTLDSSVLSHTGSSTSSCNATTGTETSADRVCLLSTGGRNFSWIEGSYDANNGPAEQRGIYVIASNFWRARNVSIVNSGNPVGAVVGYGFRVDNSKSGMAKDVVAHSHGGSGFYLRVSTHNMIDGLEAHSNGVAGLNIRSPSANNSFQNLELHRNESAGLLMEMGQSATYNDLSSFRNLNASRNSDAGISLTNTTNSQFFDIRSAANTGGGIEILALSSGNLFHRFNISVSTWAGLLLNASTADSNNFVQGVINGGSWGANSANGDLNKFVAITAANLGDHAGNAGDHGGGISLTSAGDGNTFHNFLISNTARGGVYFRTAASSTNTFSNVASMDNQYPVNLQNYSNNSKFTGLLLVGTNDTDNCNQSGGTNPGLSDQTCTTTGTDGSNSYTGGYLSDATLRTGLTAESAFVGKVSSADINNSDTNGGASFPADPDEFDWVNFDNIYRSWGIDGSAFPNADHRSVWESGAGRIWDFRLRSSMTNPLLNRSGDGTSDNAAFVADVACPSAVDGNATATDQQTSANTYLLNAIEIVDPEAEGYSSTGDHDGLCESNESCLYAPNFGAYQGQGNLISCTFSDGTVSGITMYGYDENGVP